MKKTRYIGAAVIIILAILCGCGRAAETAPTAAVTPGLESPAFTQSKSIACVRVPEREILPDYKSFHSAEPLSPIGEWSGGDLVDGYYFAVNGEFRICDGKNACRVKTNTGEILYYHYEDGAFTPRKALSCRGKAEFSSGAMPVKFNYWLEDGALVIDNLDGEGGEAIAYAKRFGSETDRVLLASGMGTNNLELATIDLDTGKSEPVDTGSEPCSDVYFDSGNTRMLLHYASGEWGLMQDGEAHDLRALTGIQGRFFACWEPDLGTDGLLITVQDSKDGTLPVYAYDCRTGVTRELLPDAKSYDGTASTAPYYQPLSRAKYLCCYPDKTVSVIDLAAKTERKIDGCEWHTDTDGVYGALGGGFYFSRNGGSLARMGFLDCGSGKLTIADRTPDTNGAMQEWNSPECFDTGVFVLGVGDMLKPQYILVYDFCPD